MKLQIAGVHMEVGESLRDHCEEKMKGLKAYFSQLIDVDINFQQDAHRHIAEVTVHASGINLRAHGEGEEFYQAIDDAARKLERQLKKYKGRLQKHRKRRQEAANSFDNLPAMEATHHVVEEESLDDFPDEGMFAEFMPKIVHKDVKSVQTLTVDEAVMQMDLLHMNFFIFQNLKTKQLNIVYRDESGGHIGWVEPSAAVLAQAS